MNTCGVRTRKRRQAIRVTLGLLALWLGTPLASLAQGTVDPDHGLLAVTRWLRGLGSMKRVLVIGAHPDDEDTSLLSVLVRGMGADAAYLSLNRGEGGQNLIGPELGLGLGLLRSEELLSARRHDGAEQYFSRAYDFGYSKSAEETFRLWPKDSLLADVVYVVRRFRPQIVVSVFSGTRRDGHGQHQAAGILAWEAFTAAGDPGRFPEQLGDELQPWTPLKLYRSTRFDSAATTLSVETGRLDPIYGRSYHQIAMAGRSQHRSQDMGRIEALGPRRTRLQLIESRARGGSGPETALFEGIDTTLVGMAATLSAPEARRALAEGLAAYGAHLERARDAVGRAPWEDAASHLTVALAKLRSAREVTARAGPDAAALHFVLGEDEKKLQAALAETAGLIVDAFADDDLVVPGQSVEVEVQIWNGGPLNVELRGVSLRTPEGWLAEPLGSVSRRLERESLSEQRFRLTVPYGAEPTQPYFLRRPLQGAVYEWPANGEIRTQPFEPPPVQAEVALEIGGEPVWLRVPTVHSFADQARGEVRRPLFVVPAIDLGLAPTLALSPRGREGSFSFNVSLRSESPRAAQGRVRLEVPEGWVVTPSEARFEVAGPGRSVSIGFRVELPAELAAGQYELRPVAETEDGRRYNLGYTVIDYPHIQRRLLFEPAVARIAAVDLELKPGLRVGYVPGAGDALAGAIAAMGARVEVLDDRAVASGDLSSYDVIVLGIRAYETNATLVESNERLLAWVRSGGTLISQYQQYGFFNDDYAPYRLKARFPHDRVADEEAPIQILVPEHPLFRGPNSIGPADFDGWVQERGLYFANEWDPRYQALLETADPGESPKRGGLLVARYGEGVYVYTGLALFRQISAGVPGAYRLLANLISLD